MDLDRIAAELKHLEASLEARAKPVRGRIMATGPARLYAMAAESQRASDLARDPDQHRLHRSAAVAAQAFADRLVAAA